MKTRIMLAALVALIAAGSALADSFPIMLDATQDAGIWSRADKQVVNYGAAEQAKAWSGDGSNPRRMLIGFDTSSLVGQSVTEATLRVQVFGSYGGSSGAPTAHEMEIHRLTQPFNEGTGNDTAWVGAAWVAYDYATPGDSGSQLSWPGGDGALGDAVQEDPNFMTVAAPYGTTEIFLDIPVTASVQAAAAGLPHHGYVITFADETGGDNWLMVYSTESAGGMAAQLIVVPEPATIGLMSLASLCMLRRRR